MRALMFCGLLLAGTSLTPAQKIQMTTTAAPLEQATVSDIDFIRSTTPKWLFTVDLRIPPSVSQPANALLEIRGDIVLTGGRSEQDVIFMRTKPFLLDPARTLTNLDLRAPDLKDVYTFDENKLDALGIKGIALSSALLPAGVYTLHVTVQMLLNGSPGGEVASSDIVYILRNPSRVELLFPLDGDRSVSPFPLFQWLYDGPTSRLAIYEKLPGQQSLEETVSGVPVFETTVNQTVFQYPSGGVRALQPGKTYVWSVAGRALSAGGGSEDIQSPLRSFSVSRDGGISSLSSLLDELEQALGPRYEALFTRIREEGFGSTGSIQLNGSTITTERLRQLIEEIRANPGAVKSVQVQ